VIEQGLSAAKAWAGFREHPVLDTLKARYDEPWRAHHAWHHPMSMIQLTIEAEREGVAIVDGTACIGFCLWHDAVYDPESAHGRNERLSASLAASEMSAMADAVSTARSCEATLATIGHRPVGTDLCPDIALNLDVDLAILGADERRYDLYDQVHIPKEYGHVEPAFFASRRAGILRGFLDRKDLYLTEWGRARFEAKARANLARSIERLEAAIPPGWSTI
jgi:predicted metal-dependent HD superfamily phosphohydrolase